MQAVEELVGRSLKKFEPLRLKRFMFNDTVVLAYLLEGPILTALADVETFCHVLRAFETLSISNGILFRGSLAIGELYKVDEESGTIMGPAVSDAAAWYGSSDWIGINATPRASIIVDALTQTSPALDHVLVDYDVPFKDSRHVRLKVINWPKGFYVRGLKPVDIGPTAKATLLNLLSQHMVPKGAESKYFNTVAFFDYIEQGQHLGPQFGQVPTPAPEGRS
jgi:hypothetical protein